MMRALMLRTAAARGVLAAAVLLAPTHALYAQTPTGTITGHVNDPGNLAVPGATIICSGVNIAIDNVQFVSN